MAASTLPENTTLDKVVFPEMLTELDTTLGDFESVTSQVACLKRETMEMEAAVLTAVLERVKPLVPFLSRDCELYYQRELVIIRLYERTPLDGSSYFYNEHQLILYENGRLVRAHRYGELSPGPRPGWESRDEEEVTTQAAIATFGFAAIAEGLTQAFEAAAPIVLKEELDSRLAVLSQVLGALQ